MTSSFTSSEVCEKLGIHKQTLEKYQRERKLLPDFQFPDGERVYYADTLEKFEMMYRSNMLTIGKIAKIFGISETTVSHHFRRKRQITPDAKNGRFSTYSDGKVMMVARSEGWCEKVKEDIVGNARYGTMYIPSTNRWCAYKRENGILVLISRRTTEEGASAAMLEKICLRRGQPR